LVNIKDKRNFKWYWWKCKLKSCGSECDSMTEISKKAKHIRGSLKLCMIINCSIKLLSQTSGRGILFHVTSFIIRKMGMEVSALLLRQFCHELWHSYQLSLWTIWLKSECRTFIPYFVILHSKIHLFPFLRHARPEGLLKIWIIVMVWPYRWHSLHTEFHEMVPSHLIKIMWAQLRLAENNESIISETRIYITHAHQGLRGGIPWSTRNF